MAANEKIINGCNCLCHCIFNLKRVNSPQIGFFWFVCFLSAVLYWGKLPKGEKRRIVCLREAAPGGHVHDQYSVFILAGKCNRQFPEGSIESLSQESELGQNGQMQNFSPCFPVAVVI